jgi:hypothetical protein
MEGGPIALKKTAQNWSDSREKATVEELDRMVQEMKTTNPYMQEEAIPEEPAKPEESVTEAVKKVEEAMAISQASDIATKLGGRVVGSALEKAEPGDIDVRIDGEYDGATTESEMTSLGYEFRGSSVLSPKDKALRPDKEFGEGWQRIEHFEDSKGRKVDVWHDEPAPQEESPKPEADVKAKEAEVLTEEEALPETPVPTEAGAEVAPAPFVASNGVSVVERDGVPVALTQKGTPYIDQGSATQDRRRSRSSKACWHRRPGR